MSIWYPFKEERAHLKKSNEEFERLDKIMRDAQDEKLDRLIAMMLDFVRVTQDRLKALEELNKK